MNHRLHYNVTSHIENYGIKNITYLTINQPTIAIPLDMHDHPGLKRKEIVRSLVPLILIPFAHKQNVPCKIIMTAHQEVA